MKFSEVKLYSPSFHTISGMPGSGKGVLGIDIAARLHRQTGKPVYISKVAETRSLPEDLPKYIKGYSGTIPPVDSIYITTDAHIKAHARRAMTDVNVELDKVHGMLRHDNVDYIYDTQSLAEMDRNNVKRSNYRWHKKPYDLDVDMGRPEVRMEVMRAREMDLSVKEALLYGQTLKHKWDGVHVTDIPLPGFWSDELSKMHRRREPLLRRVWPP